MNRLPTQFDGKSLATTVATPTCSSCCCCCCCLATTFASSSLLAQRINREAKKKDIKDRLGLNILALLFLPVAGVLAYLSIRLMAEIFTSCTERIYRSSLGNRSYEVCTSPVYGLPALLIVFFSVVFVLWYLYKRVRIENPTKRAFWVGTLISIAFALEFVGGAFLVLSTAGLGYLVAVPFIGVFLTGWYWKHLSEEPLHPMPAEAPKPAAFTNVPGQIYPTPLNKTEETHEVPASEQPPTQDSSK